MSWVADPDRDRLSPLAWSVPYVRIGGLEFRLHWLFMAFAAVVMLRSFLSPAPEAGEGAPPAGPAVVGIALVSLLVIVTLREVVRALVIRASGGSADSVVVWPLGALRGADPAPRWRSMLAASLVGPAVSALLFAGLAVPLGLSSGEWLGCAIPHPFDDSWLRNPHPRWIEVLWITQRTGMQLAMLHAIPMLPLDMGQALGAIMARVRGHHDGLRATTSFSIAVAISTAVLALLRDQNMLLAAAVACFVEGALQLRRLQVGDAVASQAPWELGAPDADAETPEPEDREDLAARRLEEGERERQEKEARELDRILEKIGQSGMESLTSQERALLKQATQRRQKKEE